MPSKRHKAEGIVTKLRQVDVLTAPGRPDPGLDVRRDPIALPIQH
jgi:hypothetical protein